MTLFILGHKFHYEVENLCRMFYSNAEIIKAFEYTGGGDEIITRADDCGDTVTWTAVVDVGGRRFEESKTLPEGCEEAELELCRCLYDCLIKATGQRPAWGLLTGVRPVKLINRLIKDHGEEEAARYFTEKLCVSSEKTALAMRTAEAQREIVAQNTPRSFSLYVSIPFCPSRCSYCSFVSHSITNANAAKLVAPYVEKLASELELIGEYAHRNGLKLESVYFGGGTPGILSSQQSKKLINTINESFDMSACREFTFEAGRADVITEEKLETLRLCGVDRVSVNPQTYDDRVLAGIGRKHTAAEAVQAFRMARNAGFESINTDLIAGLPGESTEGFCASLDKAVALGSDNITVHALALKRASAMVSQMNSELEQSDRAAKMLEYADKALTEHGYLPYYLYRQSRCVGNLENVGWCLPGKECVYNVYMMEEIHTVLAAGAGAVTRLKAPFGSEVERIFNFKYPYEYISRFEEILERKRRISGFYDDHVS